MEKKGFEIVLNKKEKSADIWIYEDIGDDWFGGLSAKGFADEMKKIGDVDTLNVFINSQGGNVFDGVSIYSILSRQKANVVVEIDGLAASIASVIAMAGNEVRMSENAMIMIHDPWSFAVGNSEEMRKAADDMDKIKNSSILPAYTKKTGMDESKISDMMSAETWMGSTEAKELGFIDEITAEKKMAAHVNINKYNFKHVPDSLKKGEGDMPSEKKDDIIETPCLDKWNKRISAR